ncbi:outer membrane protein [Aurantimonas sp. VKM B-3413]|uniref:outer membrane protein n=1 Tax=Aurantimonas sp. VKM B-3413 TaxID=2779401 RepID=UPI001E5BC4F8|nr:outer membrane protein [Aurantimonas sp. VKM B-3413]MCB8839283.1 porin family protein [Aurantimonas sp. VKM B-3413]
MNRRFLTTVAAFGVVSSFVGSAQAADLIEPPAYIAPPPPPPAQISTAGWYLRGDVGYVFKNDTDGDWDFYNYGYGENGIDDTHRYDSLTLKGAALFSGGFGYRFTDNFRADATLDYFKTDIDGRTECPYQIKVGHGIYNPAGGCHYEDSGEATVWTAMANAYVDIGHFGRFTPYIGAGIGAAHVSYDTGTNQEVCADCAPSYDRYRATHDGVDSWRFASSLMAGASVDISDKLKFDAGYKYTRISGGDAYEFDANDKANGASGVQMRDNGFNIHTVRAGLRYEFGGGQGFGKGKAPVVGAPYEEPAPIYSEAPIYDQAPVYK